MRATKSLIDTSIIMAQIPVACLGGVLGLFVTGTPFSVSAAVGFISIFGIAVMDGILLSFYMRQLWQEGHPFAKSIILGSDRRLRATMMTDLVDAFGLLRPRSRPGLVRRLSVRWRSWSSAGRLRSCS